MASRVPAGKYLLSFHKETNSIDEKTFPLSLEEQGKSFPSIKKASQSEQVA
jgi:hypothetical protein